VTSDGRSPIYQEVFFRSPSNEMSCQGMLPDDAPGGTSIWFRSLSTAPSCSAPPPSKQDPQIARSCNDDPTALVVDLSAAGSASAKNRCFHYESACSFDINKVKEISFDLDAQGCADVWTAPLWMVPPNWGPTQWVSGEIDFFEICQQKPTVSFGSEPGQHGVWSVDANHVQNKVRIHFDHATDTITSEICDLRSEKCQSSGYTRHGYFEDIKKSHNPAGTGMTFVSDIWNGSSGDGGFLGCARGGQHDSSCKYSVKNVKVSSTTGEKLFTGTCAALNA
jgi:hypothetical protein